MPTQGLGFPAVSLSFEHSFRHVRLLEIPEELLDIIVKTDQQLYFKSAVSTSHTSNDGGSDEREGHLHLCGDEKSWLAKQVSTSNSILITQSNTEPPHEDEDEDQIMGDEPDSKKLITVIAKPLNVLELLPVASSNYESTILGLLDQYIPTIFAAEHGPSRKSSYSISDLHGHMPTPQRYITQVLAAQCVFELPWSLSKTDRANPSTRGSGGDLLSSPFVFDVSGQPKPAHTATMQAYIPSPRLLLDTWRKIVETATLSETKIDGGLEADILLEASLDMDGVTEGVEGTYKAVAKRMFERDGYFVALGIITKSENVERNNHLNEKDMTRWVGNTLLKVMSETKSIGKEDFEKMWEDIVPASWLKHCSAEVLGSACTIAKYSGSGYEVVSWMPFTNEYGDVGVEIGSIDAPVENYVNPTVVSNGKGKRRWHEKFAAQRNVKR